VCAAGQPDRLHRGRTGDDRRLSSSHAQPGAGTRQCAELVARARGRDRRRAVLLLRLVPVPFSLLKVMAMTTAERLDLLHRIADARPLSSGDDPPSAGPAGAVADATAPRTSVVEAVLVEPPPFSREADEPLKTGLGDLVELI